VRIYPLRTLNCKCPVTATNLSVEREAYVCIVYMGHHHFFFGPEEGGSNKIYYTLQ
jgi:hypothetical protein